jgi:predicted component of type VI protein secretion system
MRRKLKELGLSSPTGYIPDTSSDALTYKTCQQQQKTFTGYVNFFHSFY